MGAGRAWTMMEVTILRKEFPVRVAREVAEMLDRPVCSVKKKAQHLGLKKVRDLRAIEWTPQMISLLTTHYPTMFNSDLAKMLKVSKNTLIAKAKELGLRKVDNFLQVKREALNARKGIRTSFNGCFQKGNEAGKLYGFKPGHRLSPEAEAKRIEGIKRSYARKRMLKMCGLKDLK